MLNLKPEQEIKESNRLTDRDERVMFSQIEDPEHWEPLGRGVPLWTVRVANRLPRPLSAVLGRVLAWWAVNP